MWDAKRHDQFKSKKELVKAIRSDKDVRADFVMSKEYYVRLKRKNPAGHLKEFLYLACHNQRELIKCIYNSLG